MALLQELISRFSKKGDIVVDPFGGTFSTAIACFSLPEHRKFVGCEKDTVCFELAQIYVVKKFAATIAQKKNWLRSQKGSSRCLQWNNEKVGDITGATAAP